MVMVVDLMARFFFATAGDSFLPTILAEPLLLLTITIFFVMGLVVEISLTSSSTGATTGATVDRLSVLEVVEMVLSSSSSLSSITIGMLSMSNLSSSGGGTLATTTLVVLAGRSCTMEAGATLTTSTIVSRFFFSGMVTISGGGCSTITSAVSISFCRCRFLGLMVFECTGDELFDLTSTISWSSTTAALGGITGASGS
uniref:(northern house mosquito) hypothetical protein n=1 Tax=Culex pipiens TaxID=7175 RepID=A0A8D8JVA2_CULPI